MRNRMTAVVAGAVAGLCLFSGDGRAGPTTYDMAAILYEEHPFATAGLRPPQPAYSLPPSQIRAPARVPQPAIPPRAAARPAAQPNMAERRPATATGSLAAAPSGSGGGSRIVSEIRIGFLVHDQGPFSRNEEDGFDGNLEVLFTSPGFLEAIWAPRPHIGVTANSAGDTSQAYLGLSWEWSFLGNWFAGFSLGGSIHDGELETNRTDRKELGCRVLFRESIDVGYRFGGRHAVSGFLDHISNGNLCDRNEGLENFGIRYGYLY